jgi:hypothetical protein
MFYASEKEVAKAKVRFSKVHPTALDHGMHSICRKINKIPTVATLASGIGEPEEGNTRFYISFIVSDETGERRMKELFKRWCMNLGMERVTEEVTIPVAKNTTLNVHRCEMPHEVDDIIWLWTFETVVDADHITPMVAREMLSNAVDSITR